MDSYVAEVMAEPLLHGGSDTDGQGLSAELPRGLRRPDTHWTRLLGALLLKFSPHGDPP
jgi:hypothetical protein